MKNYTITVNGTAYQVTDQKKDLQAQQLRLQQQLQHRQLLRLQQQHRQQAA